jgi:hypothetical protein
MAPKYPAMRLGVDPVRKLASSAYRLAQNALLRGGGDTMIEPRPSDVLVAHLSIGAAGLNQAQLKLCRSVSKANEHFVVARWDAHFQTSDPATTRGRMRKRFQGLGKSSACRQKRQARPGKLMVSTGLT